MADAPVARKRSRSSSDSDNDKNHKRVNVGAPSPTQQRDTQSVSLRDDSKLKSEPSSASVSAHPTSDSTMPDNTNSATAQSSKSTDEQKDTKDGKDAPPVAQSQISMRCLIVTQDASIIIGKGGSHVNEIREKSGAKVAVSESIPGNPERILNVSGPLDAVSKAFGLIVRRINDEPFDVPSVPGSRAVTIKFMIPNSRMGSVIGRQGTKIKEIQDASGARLNASEGMLPGSTERVLSVAGVADAIHIATYYIGNILIEANERAPHSSTHSSYRPSSSASSSSSSRPRPSSYSTPYTPHSHGPPAQLQEQKIYIPNDLVGCIIGKGGSKINELRHLSVCNIKIMEPGAQNNAGGPENERLVVITGQPANIQMAVSMLYHRLEQEKQKQLSQTGTSSASHVR